MGLKLRLLSSAWNWWVDQNLLYLLDVLYLTELKIYVFDYKTVLSTEYVFFKAWWINLSPDIDTLYLDETHTSKKVFYLYWIPFSAEYSLNQFINQFVRIMSYDVSFDFSFMGQDLQNNNLFRIMVIVLTMYSTMSFKALHN